MTEQEKSLRNPKQELLGLAQHFTAVAEATLRFKDLDQEEREELQMANGTFLHHWFAPWLEQVPEHLHIDLFNALLQAFIVGSRGTTSKSGRAFLREESALLIRTRKQIKRRPLNVALAEIITKLCGPAASSKPKKEATVILDDVNKLLAARGFAAVKVDVVRRRLEIEGHFLPGK